MRKIIRVAAIGLGGLLVTGGILWYMSIREPIPDGVVRVENPPGNPADWKIVIRKSSRRLMLRTGDGIQRTYSIVLGNTPVGDKEREGDGRTPEGEFYVCNRNPKSRFYLSLGLSYPDAEDAERGLKAGLITQDQHDRILAAIENRQTPPWDTPLGGEIFIHGGGVRYDWTRGCIALSNMDILEIFNTVPVGTAVVIEP